MEKPGSNIEEGRKVSQPLLYKDICSSLLGKYCTQLCPAKGPTQSSYSTQGPGNERQAPGANTYQHEVSCDENTRAYDGANYKTSGAYYNDNNRYGYILHVQYHLLPKPSFGLISVPILNKVFTNNLGVQGPLIQS